MYPCCIALATIWCGWLSVFVVSTAVANAGSETATTVSYLVLFLGIPAAVLLSLVAVLAIAAARLLERRD